MNSTVIRVFQNVADIDNWEDFMKNQAPERRPGAILSEHSFPDFIPGSGFSAILNQTLFLLG